MSLKKTSASNCPAVNNLELILSAIQLLSGKSPVTQVTNWAYQDENRRTQDMWSASLKIQMPEDKPRVFKWAKAIYVSYKHSFETWGEHLFCYITAFFSLWLHVGILLKRAHLTWPDGSQDVDRINHRKTTSRKTSQYLGVVEGVQRLSRYWEVNSQIKDSFHLSHLPESYFLSHPWLEYRCISVGDSELNSYTALCCLNTRMTRYLVYKDTLFCAKISRCFLNQQTNSVIIFKELLHEEHIRKMLYLTVKHFPCICEAFSIFLKGISDAFILGGLGFWNAGF